MGIRGSGFGILWWWGGDRGGRERDGDKGGTRERGNLARTWEGGTRGGGEEIWQRGTGGGEEEIWREYRRDRGGEKEKIWQRHGREGQGVGKRKSAVKTWEAGVCCVLQVEILIFFWVVPGICTRLLYNGDDDDDDDDADYFVILHSTFASLGVSSNPPSTPTSFSFSLPPCENPHLSRNSPPI